MAQEDMLVDEDSTFVAKSIDKGKGKAKVIDLVEEDDNLPW